MGVADSLLLTAVAFAANYPRSRPMPTAVLGSLAPKPRQLPDSALGLRDGDADSSATSTSRIREFAAQRLVRAVWMFWVVTSKRFITAPNFARVVDTAGQRGVDAVDGVERAGRS